VTAGCGCGLITIRRSTAARYTTSSCSITRRYIIFAISISHRRRRIYFPYAKRRDSEYNIGVLL